MTRDPVFDGFRRGIHLTGGGCLSKLLSVYLEHEEEINRYADAGEKLPAFVRRKAIEELRALAPRKVSESTRDRT
jgi:hypothetical protein